MTERVLFVPGAPVANRYRAYPPRRSRLDGDHPVNLALNLLIIAALIVVAPLALAMLLITATAITTTFSQGRSHRRMMRGLDELIRERR